jgi:hypothetical protein
MESSSAENLCTVCEEATEPHTEAVCNGCGEIYHLNQRADLPGKDCGEVWINEDHQALEFACNRCLHPEEAPANLDDILDLAEAALAVGLSEEALLLGVEQGRLRSKRFAGGALIFERRDVVEFAARLS